MKSLLLSMVLFFSVSAQAANHCQRYESSPNMNFIVELSKKLSYELSELCELERIADIQFEQRRYYYADSDQFESHKVITLHYWEYSCEYHFNLERDQWQNKRNYCYSTF